jgi:hypothetical protein
VRNTPVASAVEPKKRILDSENAARTEITMVMATTHTVTITVFLKKMRKSVSRSRLR